MSLFRSVDRWNAATVRLRDCRGKLDDATSGFLSFRPVSRFSLFPVLALDPGLSCFRRLP